MRNLLLETAGVLAFFISIAHGVLGETKIFARAQIEPPPARRLMRLVWHCSAVAWGSLAILLFFAPRFEGARDSIVAVSVVTYGFGAIANAWATRGRHIGWMALAVVVGLAVAGR